MGTKTIITYGTFDLFHVGHVRLLKRLRNMGDRLVVGLSTDSFNLEKGKKVIFPYEQRQEILLSTRYVDKVFPEQCWEQKSDDIIREKADIFAMGDDWSGEFDSLKSIIEVVYLPRTNDVSTTDIKNVMNKLQEEQIHELRNVTLHLQNLVKKLC